MNLGLEWYFTNEKLPRHMERVVIEVNGKQYPATFDAERKKLIVQGLPHTAYCVITNIIVWKKA